MLFLYRVQHQPPQWPLLNCNIYLFGCVNGIEMRLLVLKIEYFVNCETDFEMDYLLSGQPVQ